MEAKKISKNIIKAIKDNALTFFICLMMIIISVGLVALMCWGVYTSLKTQINWDDDPVGLPTGWPWDWAWSNISTVFNRFVVKVDYTNAAGAIIASKVPVNIWYMLIYTLIYAGGGAVVMSMTTCIMGYMTARYPNKFSSILTVVVITVMALPVVGSSTSELQIMIKLGLYNTLTGAIVQKFNFLGVYFLVFQAFFVGLSNEYAEAAEIDGASQFRILWNIMIPMARNILFTVILLNFVGLWNDYNSPLLYFPSYPTLAYGLYYITSGPGAYETAISNPPMRLAASMILFVPILTIFIIFRNRIIGNVTMGGVKE
jgi:ABC-type glycerol-3-phosphate transport system permease component